MSVVLSSFRARLQATERELAIEALRVAGGGIKAAARLVGLDRSQMRRIVVRHELQNLLVSHSPGVGSVRGGNDAWKALG